MVPRLVCRKIDRREVILWMMHEVQQSGTQTRIASKAVSNESFRKLFPCSTSRERATSRKKAAVWWNQKDEYLQKLQSEKDKQLVVTSRNVRTGAARSRWYLKCMSGRGRKRAPWSQYVHDFVINEFERLSGMGIPITSSLLLDCAFSSLSQPDCPYLPTMIDTHYGKQIREMINSAFVTRVLQSNHIVARKRTGSLSRSEQHTERLHRKIAYYLGEVQRKFEDGTFIDGQVENMDETHFWYDMDDAIVLARKGSETIKYKDVVQSDKGMTMILRVKSGVGAKIHDPFFIFENANANYPIQGFPDDVLEVRTERKSEHGWIDQRSTSG